jgi:hypothetical protein
LGGTPSRRERCIASAPFEVANDYELPFAEASFDVDSAHTAEQHPPSWCGCFWRRTSRT